MTAAILATAAAVFELQACRDVESEKIDQVNELYDQLSSPPQSKARYVTMRDR
jgi:hypothetical protein